MADVPVPSIVTATPAAADTVLGVQGGAVKRFNASALAALAPFTQAGTGAVARTAHDKLRESLSVKDFGAVGDGLTDDTPAIQAALNAAQYKTVYFPSGTYLISASLNFRTQTRLLGDGMGSIIKAAPGWAPAPPAVAAGAYSPTLSYAPLLYNASPVQWWAIEGLCFDGNNQNCYGVWLAENFYGTIKDVYVLNCNKRPYTNIRGQATTHLAFVAYGCNDGVLSYDNTNFCFIGCGFERLSGDWSYDQRQPNSFSKGGVALDDCWFESDGTHFPAQGFLRMSGRRNRASIHANLHTAATTERALELNDTTSSVTVDGITMGGNPCVGGDFTVNNSSGAMPIKASAGTRNNIVRGSFTAAKVDDDGIGNSFDVNFSLSTPVPHFTGRFQVRYGDNGAGIPIVATNFVLDADYNAGNPVIRLLGSNNNFLGLNSGKLVLNSNLGQEHVAGGVISFSSSGGYSFAGASGAAGYQKPVYLGAFSLWVDSAGKLRIKSGAPVSDLDGAIVGAQT